MNEAAASLPGRARLRRLLPPPGGRDHRPGAAPPGLAPGRGRRRGRDRGRRRVLPQHGARAGRRAARRRRGAPAGRLARRGAGGRRPRSRGPGRRRRTGCAWRRSATRGPRSWPRGPPRPARRSDRGQRLAGQHPGAEVDVGAAGDQVGRELLELLPLGGRGRRLQVGELGPHQDQVVPLDLRLHHPGAVAQLAGRALLRGQRRDDLLRPGGLAGLLRRVRADQVGHADRAHHGAVPRDVAGPQHLGAVASLQRRLQAGAEHRQRAVLGHVGRGPYEGAAVELELGREQLLEGQRLRILGPGPDVLPLAEGLVEAGGPGSVRGQPQRCGHRSVHPRLVQELVPGERARRDDQHGRHGQPRHPGGTAPGPGGPPRAPPRLTAAPAPA